MDTPDWEQLVNLVEENGAGCIKFWLKEANDGDDLELSVETIGFDGESGDIDVRLV